MSKSSRPRRRSISALTRSKTLLTTLLFLFVFLPRVSLGSSPWLSVGAATSSIVAAPVWVTVSMPRESRRWPALAHPSLQAIHGWR